MMLKKGTPEWQAYMAGRAAAERRKSANPWRGKRGKQLLLGWWDLGLADGKRLKAPALADGEAGTLVVDQPAPKALPEALRVRQEYCDAVERALRKLWNNSEQMVIPPCPFPHRQSPYRSTGLNWDRLTEVIAATVAEMVREMKPEKTGPAAPKCGKS